MVRVDRRSVRIAVRDAQFPAGTDTAAVERALERDIIDAMRTHGITGGVVSIGLGDFNYDVHPGGVVKRGGRRGKKDKTQ